MNTIDIGIKIDLPKLLDTRLLVQAGSGGGKSYLLRKLIESVGTGVQQIILDPEGEYVTLREKFPFALVSKGGDIPISLKYAETIATKLLETGMSAIIDLYELKHHERIIFVDRFLKALMNAPKALWHSALIYVDEAHIFCPESSKSEAMASVIDLCTRGRKRGFSAVLATQRLSKLHKDAAAECLNKMIGRTGLDIDRKRSGEELGMTVKQDALQLRNLQPGVFHGFGPAISTNVKVFKVGKVVTTHPEAGRRIISIPPTPDAIKDIVAKLKDIPEEAEKELQTRQQLEAELSRLRAELKKEIARNGVSQVATTAAADLKHMYKVAEDAANEFQVIKQEADILSKQMQAVMGEVNHLNQLSGKFQGKIRDFGISVIGLYSTLTLQQVTSVATDGTYHIDLSRAAKRIEPIEKKQVVVTMPGEKLQKCPLAILTFLAQFGREFSVTQIGRFTGYSPTSGGFRNALSTLNTHGLIRKQGDRVMVNPNADITAFTGPLGQRKEYGYDTMKPYLGKCEREIYEVLLEHPQQRFDVAHLAASTPSRYSPTSGGFRNSISSLKGLELIINDHGSIRLNLNL